MRRVIAVAAMILCACGVAAAQDANSSAGAAATSGAPAAEEERPKPIVVTESAANDLVKKRMAVVYPPEAIAATMSGVVKLQILVGPKGYVLATRAVSGPVLLADAAKSGVSRAVYAPTMVDGKPVHMATTIRLAFGLDTSSVPPAATVRELLATQGQEEDAAALRDLEPFAFAPGMGWQNGKPKVEGVTWNVTAARLLRGSQPEYPRNLKEEHIEGTVVLSAVIEKDGTLGEIKFISGPKPLAQSAIDAVKGWRYAPTLLLGEPVEVDTTISFVFSLHGPPPKP
jgi:TonB family protein